MKLIAIRKLKVDGTQYAPGDEVPWFPNAGLCVDHGFLRVDGVPPMGAKALLAVVEAGGLPAPGEAPQDAPKRRRGR